MAAPRLTGMRALAKLKEERAGLEQREAQARREAADELVQVILNAGAEEIPPRELRTLLTASIALGVDRAIALLQAPDNARAPVRNGKGTADGSAGEGDDARA